MTTVETKPGIVTIRRNSDGKIVTFKDEHALPWWTDPDIDEGEPYLNFYIWSDGNYACDCNRSLFFDENANEGIDPSKEEDQYNHGNSTRHCSDGKYYVEIRSLDGELLYQDERRP